MIAQDLEYFRLLSKSDLIQSPFLEVGAGMQLEDPVNLCTLAREAGVDSTLGADLAPNRGVDLIFDFSIPHEEFKAKWRKGQFGTVAIFNTLEHTFDPSTTLRNALYCTRPGGTLLALVPAIWPIHSFPKDYNRLLPDWFSEFARRNQLEIIEDSFCWISEFGIQPVKETEQFQSFTSSAKKAAPARYWKSRIFHRLLNTFGRSHWATHVGLAVAFQVPLSKTPEC